MCGVLNMYNIVVAYIIYIKYVYLIYAQCVIYKTSLYCLLQIIKVNRYMGSVFN